MTDTHKPRDILDRVSAYVVFFNSTPLAAIAIRHPLLVRERYASARVTWGRLPPVEGRGSGRFAFGHDATTRACSDAAHRMSLELPETEPVEMQHHYPLFVYALRNQAGRYNWAHNLRIYNFHIVQAL